jgi:hypothetical protein
MQPRAWKDALRFALVAAVFGGMISPRALAQEKREPEGTPLPDYAKVYPLAADHEPVGPVGTNGLPNIMLTGYWPPTNEMLRRFSPNPEQNPEGWIGENWEGRGYNVYAYFPEFPGGLGKGEGDFEVDYQDTSADFWPIADSLGPVAIVTFGRAGEDLDWELEWRQRNLGCTFAGWLADYLAPVQPTPCPPDETADTGFRRYSTLPMPFIVDAVDGAGLGINPFVDSTAWAGRFLCEFIGYHAQWYHDLHADPSDPVWNIAAGHVHVGSLIGLPEAIAATEVTVRTLIEHLDVRRAVPGDFDDDGDLDFDDYAELSACMTGPCEAPPCHVAPLYADMQCGHADFENDGDVDLDDFRAFQEAFSGP